MSWTSSTDNIGVAGYRIYRNGMIVASPTKANGTLYSVDNGMSYFVDYISGSVAVTFIYTVAAFDAAGNTSAQSNSASVVILVRSMSMTAFLFLSTPSGATVSNINSGYVYCQSTPCVAQVAYASSFNIQISKTGYSNWTNLVYAFASATKVVEATLTLAPTPTPTPTPSSVILAPTSVSAYLGTGMISVIWPSGTASKYNVYRCVVDYGCGGATAYGYVYTAPTAYYEDSSITPGSTYSYKVTACDSNNSNCSGGTISNSVSYPASNPTASVSFDNFSKNLASVPKTRITRDLYIGSTGNDVKQLQALLVNEVSYPADLITGYFGRITKEAVKKLQEKLGVQPVSGYFGEITRKALKALISN